MAIADNPIWTDGAAGPAAMPSRSAVRLARIYFAVLSVLGVVAMVFGIENRLAPVGAFLFAPPIDAVPPLTGAAWFGAFAVHQQDPVFVACGGSENLAQFKALYWWEWMREASLVLLVAVVALGLVAALLRFRFALRWFAPASLVVVGYFIATALFDVAAREVETLIRYNVGQYRHAIDLTFACLAVGTVLATAIAPPAMARTNAPHAPGGFAVAAVLLAVLGIVTGALFASRNAAAVWPSVLGYEGAWLPPASRFSGFDPLWLNVTFNPYTIQLLHRLAAVVLWLGLAGAVVAMARRKAPGLWTAALVLVIVTAEITSGAVALVFGVEAVPALVHEVGTVVVVAGVLCLVLVSRSAQGLAVPASPCKKRASAEG